MTFDINWIIFCVKSYITSRESWTKVVIVMVDDGWRWARQKSVVELNRQGGRRKLKKEVFLEALKKHFFHFSSYFLINYKIFFVLVNFARHFIRKRALVLLLSWCKNLSSVIRAYGEKCLASGRMCKSIFHSYFRFYGNYCVLLECL